MNLQGIREAKGLTQTELDEKAGLTRGTTNDIERGRNKRPAHDTVVRISRVLEVAPDDWLPIDNDSAA